MEFMRKIGFSRSLAFKITNAILILSFLDLLVLGLNSNSVHSIYHAIASWILMAICIIFQIVIYAIFRKGRNKEAD